MKIVGRIRRHEGGFMADPPGQTQGSRAAVHRAAQVHHRQSRQESRIVRPPIAPYYRQLLETAKRYRRDGEHELAVISAQTACELVTETAFDKFIRVHRLSGSDKKHARPLNCDLGNERVKALYVLLSWDKIERQPFWQGFKDHTKRRHGIVHKGEKATAQEAEASLRAATDLIAHVEAVVAEVTER
jgi:hypothetical protein